jgi:hypothetical protein
MVTAAARLTPAGLVLLLVAGCSVHRTVDLSPQPVPTGTVTATPTGTDSPGATPTDSAQPTATDGTAAPATPTADSSALTNGKHPVYIRAVNVDGRALTVDVVQFFTGTAAADAARQDGAAEVPPPNDYWIRNASTLLRTLPLAADADITVNTLAAQTSGDPTKNQSVDLAQLARYNLADHLFWVTVDAGTITRIAEQFLP